MHEVKGKDGVGAKMDSMDLEREKGITIKSAATFVSWNDHHINIIDTPGHIDFTIEVERALRVLDGAVLVLCGVGGVQSQTHTVDRQMRRYKVPRIAFINKLDRMGANPWTVLKQMRERLQLNAAALQIPVGLEHAHQGVVDLLEMDVVYFEGDKGEEVRREAVVPENLRVLAEEKRRELIERVAEVDDQLMELWLEEKPISAEDIRSAIRRATIANKFVPVLMGAAFKNKGVQLLLDAATRYLPDPREVKNLAMELGPGREEGATVEMVCDPSKPLAMYAFKLEEGRFGQLTYVRIYSGTLRRGDVVKNNATGEKIRVQRLVRMHSDQMEDIQSCSAGEICAIFGVECDSGTTFTDPSLSLTCQSMHVPEPVISLAITTKDKTVSPAFSKALKRFQREDPTFRVHQDEESGEIIISGMGELHLEIYTERMRREYKLDVQTGQPQVAFRETIQGAVKFDQLLKKQTGGAGQFARIIGRLEPMEEHDEEDEQGSKAAPGAAAPAAKTSEFLNEVVGGTIPPNYMPAIEKGYLAAMKKGPLTGSLCKGIRMVVTDGAYHAVDSNEMAFRRCAEEAFRAAMMKPDAQATVMEPIMSAEVMCPVDDQGPVVNALTKRKGMVMDSLSAAGYATLNVEIPLNNMFGFSQELRSMTQGKGEFQMEYLCHRHVPRDTLEQLKEKYAKAKNDPKSSSKKD